MSECAQGAARKGTADVARAFEEKVLADAEKAKSVRAYWVNKIREAALLAADLSELHGVRVDTAHNDPTDYVSGRVRVDVQCGLELRVDSRIWHAASYIKDGLWEIDGEEGRSYTRDEVVYFMCREVLKGMRPDEE